MNDLRMRFDERGEGRSVTVDNGFDSGFEAKDCGVRIRDGFGELGQRGPVLEIVRAGDGKLRILNRERGIANCRIRNALRQPEDLVIEETGMLVMEDLNGPRIGGAVGVEEGPGLLLLGGERSGKRQD